MRSSKSTISLIWFKNQGSIFEKLNTSSIVNPRRKASAINKILSEFGRRSSWIIKSVESEILSKPLKPVSKEYKAFFELLVEYIHRVYQDDKIEKDEKLNIIYATLRFVKFVKGDKQWDI